MMNWYRQYLKETISFHFEPQAEITRPDELLPKIIEEIEQKNGSSGTLPCPETNS